MSVKFPGDQGFGPVKETKRSQAPKALKQKGKTPVADQVSFSAVLQKVSGPAPPAGAARAAKVQALKEQIAAGNYQPDLKKVAASLLKFLVERR